HQAKQLGSLLLDFRIVYQVIAAGAAFHFAQPAGKDRLLVFLNYLLICAHLVSPFEFHDLEAGLNHIPCWTGVEVQPPPQGPILWPLLKRLGLPWIPFLRAVIAR